RPESLAAEAGSTGPAALLALVGYLAGSALIIAGAMARMPTSTVALLPIAIAINIVAGQLTNMLGIPLYLDAIGTILVGMLAGPAAGTATGTPGNVTLGSAAPRRAWRSPPRRWPSACSPGCSPAGAGPAGWSPG